MSFDPNEISNPGAKIKVVGVGGGGSNAVSSMIRSNIEGVDFICANTDIQALRYALAPTKIQLGKELTKGLGAGADPDIGRDAALEDRYEIQEALDGADMVFVTAGMGGGTGTGSASVVSQIAREQGALTVGVVTKPFNFEGKRRRKHAEAGISKLKESVDTLLTIPNERLLQIATPDLSMMDAFKLADNVLVNAVKGISDIINIPGTVNVDFADVKTVMSCMGQALMGIGVASGEKRAAEAAKLAVSSPLLEDVDIEGATGILINITAGEKVSLMEVNEACMIVQDAAHEEANIIFGAVIDENLQDEIRVTVIATGFPHEAEDSFHRQESSFSRIRREVARPARKEPISHYNRQNRIVQPTSRRQEPQESHMPPPASSLKKEVSEPLFVAPEAPIAQQKPSSSLSSPTEFKKAHTPQESTNLEPQSGASSFFDDLKASPSLETQERELIEQPSNFYTQQNHAPLPEPSVNTQTISQPEPQQNQTEPVIQKESLPSHEDHASLVSDIDQKIDEALNMAEKLQEVDCSEDNLDIPAFLRQTSPSSPAKDTPN